MTTFEGYLGSPSIFFFFQICQRFSGSTTQSLKTSGNGAEDGFPGRRDATDNALIHRIDYSRMKCHPSTSNLVLKPPVQVVVPHRFFGHPFVHPPSLEKHFIV